MNIIKTSSKPITTIFFILAVFTLLSLSTNPSITISHSDKSPAHGPAVTKLATFVANNPSTLPTSWCGTETTTNQTVNSNDQNQSLLKFYYVHAADQPDNFFQASNIIQYSFSNMHDFLLGVTNQTKTINVDMGTSCGSQYVDIQSLTLPKPRSSYLLPTGEPNTSAISNDTNAILPPATNPRHNVLFLDQFYRDLNYIRGFAMVPTDSSKATTNDANDDNINAWILGNQSSDYSLATYAFAPNVFLHEITHTIGGVQNNSPNASGAAHCNDGSDVMCYADGGSKSNYNSNYCSSPIRQTAIYGNYDCNNDDYFNPSPSSGSYLSINWNTYDSDFFYTCSSANDPNCVLPPPATQPETTPQQTTATNDIYLYKKSTKKNFPFSSMKKLGSVSVDVQRAEQTPGLYNLTIKPPATIKVPKGKWKTSVCIHITHKTECNTTTSTVKKNKLKLKSFRINYYVTNEHVSGYVTATPTNKKMKKLYKIKTTRINFVGVN